MSPGILLSQVQIPTDPSENLSQNQTMSGQTHQNLSTVRRSKGAEFKATEDILVFFFFL